MKLLHTTGLLILSLFAGQAFGGWASGGGKIMKDSQNPWFLENTKTVKYCIDINEANFGVSYNRAAVEISKAIKEWKQGFDKTEDGYYQEGELVPYGQLRVATQNFELRDCQLGEEIDLRFQLGTLTPEQQERFVNPQDYVGIAVRTSYDRKTLKGKGFIYLSPVVGPLKPTHDDLDPAAWEKQNNLALGFVLLHELGHVFGVEHREYSLMDALYPNVVVSRPFLEGQIPASVKYFKSRFNVLRFLGVQDSLEVSGCGGQSPVDGSVFGEEADAELSCGRVMLQKNELTVEFKKSKKDSFKKIAYAEFNHGASQKISPGVSLYLPKEQEVFTSVPKESEFINTIRGEEVRFKKTWNGKIHIFASDEQLPFELTIEREGSSSIIVKDGYISRGGVFFN